MPPRSGRSELIDRTPQHLPVPLGGLRPRRQARGSAAPIRFWRRRRSEVAVAAGLMLAVAAALVAVTRPDLSVYLEGGAVHIGSTTLEHPADNGGLAEGIVYTGAATLLLVDRPDGSVVASGVTFVEGERVTGVCAFGPPSADEIAERCVLHLGLTAVTCHDTLRFDAPGSWQRRCSDGQDLTVAVPSGTGVVPMPFPLGR